MFDARTQGQFTTGNVLTYAHECSGVDRYLYIAFTTLSNNHNVESVEYGGQAATRLESAAIVFGTTWQHHVYVLKNPPSGVNNVVITCTSISISIRSGCVSYNGIDQTAPILDSGLVSSPGSGNNMQISLTTAEDALFIISGANVDTAFTAGANTDTLRASYSGLCDIADSDGLVLAGTSNAQMTHTGSRGYAGIALALRPASSSTYTLTAASGTFSLSGQTTGLKAARALTASPQSFSVTGVAASLARRYTLDATTAPFTLTGLDIAYSRHYALAPETGAFTLTGFQAGLSTNAQLVASAASFGFSGNAASLRVSRLLSGSVAPYALSGSPAALRAARLLSTVAANYTLSANDAAVLRQFVLETDAGAVSLTGQAAAIVRQALMSADSVAFTLTGNEVLFVRPITTRPYCAAPNPFGSVASPYSELPPRDC